MGILDNLTGGALGSLLGGGKQANLIEAIGGLIGDQQAGGLNGLVQQFTSKGLGDIVDSWVGTGPNKAITEEQIQHGLGSDAISRIASKAGLPADQIIKELVSFLPTVVDRLTPNGKIPEGDLSKQARNLLKGFLK